MAMVAVTIMPAPAVTFIAMAGTMNKPPLPLSHSHCRIFCRYPLRCSNRPESLPEAEMLDPNSLLYDPTKTGDTEYESAISVVAAMRSPHNEILIIDTPNSRMLFLDSARNIHSVIGKKEKWTHAYWDEFVNLPGIAPEGPIAILGLGGGTTAHLMLETWPSLRIEGWEIDEILIDMAREHLGLSDLERRTQAGGSLSIHIGDALSPSVSVEGGFAGIIVDLFADGKMLPQLYEEATWREIEKKLMPNGRIMVNCGDAEVELLGIGNETANADFIPKYSWLQNPMVKALYRVFPGRLSWKRMTDDEHDNYIAVTGPPPDLDAWSAALPSRLSSSVKYWRPCEPVS